MDLKEKLEAALDRVRELERELEEARVNAVLVKNYLREALRYAG